jgi:hypothetical protein
VKGYLGVLAYFDALPALLGIIRGWNSNLAMWILAVVAASTCVLIGHAIDDEARGA